MEQELASAIQELKAQGIGVAGDPSAADKYIVTVPNGEKYRLSAADLLELKVQQKLHLEGLQERHQAQKQTPNL